jgi:hypothetical protein
MSLSQELWPKKKMVNGNKKGKQNEWLLARTLTAWSGVLFTRVPGSGSFSKRIDNLRCDIIADGFDFGIETKHYATITMTKIFQIWEKAKTEHPNPLLFIRTNGTKSWLIYSEIDFKIPNVPRGTLFEYTSEEWLKMDYKTVCSYVENASIRPS